MRSRKLVYSDDAVGRERYDRKDHEPKESKQQRRSEKLETRKMTENALGLDVEGLSYALDA